jgi:hypothetical protein
MLEKEFKYYIDNQIELVKKYEGKYIVIKENKIIGVYSTEMEAYNESKQNNELGTFLIQFVSSGEQGYNQTFHSRALFVN